MIYSNEEITIVDASPEVLFDRATPGVDTFGMIIRFKSLKEAKKYRYTKLFFERLKYVAPMNVGLHKEGNRTEVYVSHRLFRNFREKSPAGIRIFMKKLQRYKGDILPPELRGAEFQ